MKPGIVIQCCLKCLYVCLERIFQLMAFFGINPSLRNGIFCLHLLKRDLNQKRNVTSYKIRRGSQKIAIFSKSSFILSWLLRD